MCATDRQLALDAVREVLTGMVEHGANPFEIALDLSLWYWRYGVGWEDVARIIVEVGEGIKKGKGTK